jgi:hypothetical protein
VVLVGGSATRVEQLTPFPSKNTISRTWRGRCPHACYPRFSYRFGCHRDVCTFILVVAMLTGTSPTPLQTASGHF